MALLGGRPLRLVFKATKHVFGMANLRSRRFLAIAVFLGFVLLTHNLLVWTKAALFAGTKLVSAHTRQMVEKIISVPASLVRRRNGFRLELHAAGVLARELRDALCPMAVQLSLPYSHLQKGGGHALFDQCPEPG